MNKNKHPTLEKKIINESWLQKRESFKNIGVWRGKISWTHTLFSSPACNADLIPLMQIFTANLPCRAQRTQYGKSAPFGALLVRTSFRLESSGQHSFVFCNPVSIFYTSALVGELKDTLNTFNKGIGSFCANLVSVFTISSEPTFTL